MDAPKYTRPENERRFLANHDFAAAVVGRPGWLIEDRYLSCGRLRLRRITDEESNARTFKLAKKFSSASAYTRPIVNIYLGEAEHAALSALDGVELRKRRIHVDEQGQRFAVDFFTGPLAALVLCEVEAATLDVLLALRAPTWAPIEVTTDPFFAGGALCLTSGQALAERLREVGR
jgi:CYTH domain-containing protein